MDLVEKRLNEISEEVDKGKMIKIDGYIKSVNKTRIKEGKSNVALRTKLAPYRKLLEQSKEKIPYLRNRLTEFMIKEYKTSKEVVDMAFNEIEESINKSIQADKMNESRKNTDYRGKYIGNGIYYNSESKKIYFQGKVFSEQTLVEEEYKPVNSSVKTILKNYIRKQLPMHLSVFSIKTDEMYKIKL